MLRAFEHTNSAVKSSIVSFGSSSTTNSGTHPTVTVLVNPIAFWVTMADVQHVSTEQSTLVVQFPLNAYEKYFFTFVSISSNFLSETVSVGVFVVVSGVFFVYYASTHTITIKIAKRNFIY